LNGTKQPFGADVPLRNYSLTHWTYSFIALFLLSADDIPECGTCQCPLSWLNVLILMSTK